MSDCGEIGNAIQTYGTFEWEISDIFSLSDKVGDHYFSPSFDFDGSEWYLCLYPNGKSLSRPQKWVAIYLFGEDLESPKTVNFRLGIKISNGAEEKKEIQREFSKDNYVYKDREFWSRSELSDRRSILIPNIVLTITLNLRSDATSNVKNDTPLASTDQAVQAVPVGEEKALKSLLGLLESGDDSDVVIKVEGKEFPAHRAILRARSAVFKSMFAHDMVEKNSGVVNIKDSDSGTFPEFLVYIYSGSCVLSADNALSLYVTADKYDVGDLKEACAEFLKRNITVECYCDVIALAVKHNDVDLIECATRFFCDNTVDVGKTAAWQTFLAENPTVANELYLKAVSKLTAQ